MKTKFCLNTIFFLTLSLISDLSIAQSYLSKKILQNPQPKIIENVSTDSYNSPKEESFFTNFAASLKKSDIFPFDYETIYTILILMQEGENGLALDIINRLAPLSEKYEEEDRDQLERLILFFKIQALFHRGIFEDVVTIGDEYLNEQYGKENFNLVLYYYTVSQAKLGKSLDKVTLIAVDQISSLNEDQQIVLRKIVCDYYLKEENYFTAIDFLKDRNKQIINVFKEKAESIIQKINELDDISDLIYESNDSEILLELVHKKLQLLVDQRDYSTAEETLAELETDQGKLNLLGVQNVFKLKRFVSVFKNSAPYKIGVILPFSHPKYGHLAYEVLEGVEMALRQLVKTQQVQLVLKDSLLDPQITEKVTRELIEDEFVVAVLGPLSRGNSLVAGEVAEFYQTPIISFSLTEEIGNSLKTLFRFQRNKKFEARKVANYAFDYLQARKFVVFYSNSLSSTIKKDEFVEQINNRGGEIVGAYEIKLNQVDFQKAFQQMTGAQRYLIDERLSNSLGREKDQIEPIVDFDAIYIPEDAQQVKFVSSFAKASEADHVWLIGGSELNNKSSYLLLGKKQLRFADTFSIGDSSTSLQSFYEDHWKMFLHKTRYNLPSAYTLYAYEITQALLSLLVDPNNHDRKTLVNSIKNISGLEVLSGKISSYLGNEILKNIKILKLENEKVIPAL